jgi:hypothetical protein
MWPLSGWLSGALESAVVGKEKFTSDHTIPTLRPSPPLARPSLRLSPFSFTSSSPHLEVAAASALPPSLPVRPSRAPAPRPLRPRHGNQQASFAEPALCASSVTPPSPFPARCQSARVLTPPRVALPSRPTSFLAPPLQQGLRRLQSLRKQRPPHLSYPHSCGICSAPCLVDLPSLDIFVGSPLLFPRLPLWTHILHVPARSELQAFTHHRRTIHLDIVFDSRFSAARSHPAVSPDTHCASLIWVSAATHASADSLAGCAVPTTTTHCLAATAFLQSPPPLRLSQTNNTLLNNHFLCACADPVRASVGSFAELTLNPPAVGN